MSKHDVDLSMYVSRRARRFAIQMPLRCRLSGEREWLEGRTENISRSGVLFRANRPMEVSSLVELSFVLPEEMGGGDGAAIFCRGWIVRALPPPAKKAPPMLAVTILEYRFARDGNRRTRSKGLLSFHPKRSRSPFSADFPEPLVQFGSSYPTKR